MQMIDQPQAWTLQCNLGSYQVYRHTGSRRLVLAWDEGDGRAYSAWIANEVIGLFSSRKGLACVPVHRFGRIRSAYVPYGLALFVAGVQPGVVLGPDRRYFSVTPILPDLTVEPARVESQSDRVSA
jgi:hypothetical protein